MNERIRELELQADEWAVANYTWTPTGNNWIEVYMEKFAQLIVEECMYVIDCNKGSDQHTEWNRALFETIEKIKEHFEVEL